MWFLRRQKTDFSEKWAKVQELLNLKRDSALKQALLEADKLLDLALKEKKVKGNTLGERLRSARKFFPEQLYRQIWSAHRLRNKLVHEDEEILSFQIEKAISAFRQALEKLNLL